MATIAINLLRWSTEWDVVERCINAVLRSDFQDFTLTYAENPHLVAPSLIKNVLKTFGSDSRLRVTRHESNLGYAGAHNRFFAESTQDLLMVLNPDAILDRSFLGNIVRAFDDPSVGAATGKMLKPGTPGSAARVLDGTGIQTSRARHARERGQLELDQGQYDQSLHVFGVSGTAAVYRKTALEAVKLGVEEYFDPDFFAYCEDFDLSWRLRLRGYACVYVPAAVVEHTRAIGISPGGLKKFAALVRHRRAFPLQVRQWSWRNHLFTMIKNDFGWGLYRDLGRIAMREMGKLIFLVVFSPDTLLATSTFIVLLPRMLRKRAIIQSSRTVDAGAASLFFQ